MPKLGVNIDHIATLRQARGGAEPDPILAAAICEKAGCDSIVAHLREDRRHIHDRDVEALRKIVRTRFNLEMSINKDIVDIACRIEPDQSTLVPEKRQELTTEGGLDAKGQFNKIKAVVLKLADSGIEVSLFIDPDKGQIEASKKIGVSMIELHTGNYADTKNATAEERELTRLQEAAAFGLSLGLIVNAGHGLNYKNVVPVARIKGVEELNIGHSIIARAAFVGLENAVREMKGLIK
ncbi:MAG: pyridoxine 5'-phosphate synthase [Candidatus Omnitrophica bacterium]|nr:pyridoxine 5'-phosphate synthase [Candidatus Omnitrophota bacterium]